MICMRPSSDRNNMYFTFFFRSRCCNLHQVNTLLLQWIGVVFIWQWKHVDCFSAKMTPSVCSRQTSWDDGLLSIEWKKIFVILFYNWNCLNLFSSQKFLGYSLVRQQLKVLLTQGTLISLIIWSLHMKISLERL